MDIVLVQCRSCGLVFNRQFDGQLVPYDANYENSQCYSPAFQSHMENLAAHLVEKYDLRHKRILEVGCGKGAFLKLICQQGDNAGAGYDTSYEGPPTVARPSIRFFRQYVTPNHITEAFDAVVCRHVVEHVPEIGDFLRQLHAIARACGNPVAIIETPALEWIIQQGSFWDIVYEHCNYFSQPCLAHLCRSSGFEILDHRLAFDGQYQILELKVRPESGAAHKPGIPPEADLAFLAPKMASSHHTIIKKLKENGAEDSWAIWGAGAKGVALVNQVNFPPPAFVIDSNPAKQGCFIPGSAIPVVSPQDDRLKDLAVILIANPVYFHEIDSFLKEKGIQVKLIAA